MPGEEQHKYWCEEHDDEGCATEWRGVEHSESGAHLLTRVLRRDGEDPVVQVSMQSEGSQTIGDFPPEMFLGRPEDSFGPALAGEAQLAYEERSR